jgi:hypothetical protein
MSGIYLTIKQGTHFPPAWDKICVPFLFKLVIPGLTGYPDIKLK